MSAGEQVKRVLLDDSAVPTAYRLRLRPDLVKFTFDGIVSIDVNIVKDTTTLQLHAKEIEFKSVAATLDGKAQQHTKVETVEKDDSHRFEFGSLKFSAGSKVTLDITFSGTLNDSMAGFYRSVYKHPDGKEEYMATTQFEPTDARRAFPCWDEPARKARFTVTLVAPKNMLALSNMPPKSERDVAGGMKEVLFEETPVMSTYLLAFIVGTFDSITAKTKDGVSVTVYTPPGKAEQGTFARDVSVKALDFYNDYFGIKYPLPKSDQVAIPDFSAGAMENWGLITYREIAILVDPKQSSAARKQSIAITVCHELAHQWFGNLVTMEWWNNLWLNEGFATFISYLAVDHLFPEWEIWTQFLVGEHGQAMQLDCLKSSHPIEVDIAHASQIDEIFDAISYAKGASVIHMLHTHLGGDKFRKGLSEYLKKFSYANAVTENLWEHMAKASGEPVLEMMTSWIKQTGHPMLTVGPAKVASNGDASYAVTQQKFLSTGIEASDKTVWTVPVNALAGATGKVSFTMLKGASGTVTVPGAGKDWVKLNAGQAGIYRVNYSPEHWALLSKAVAAGKMPSAGDRLGIVSDCFALMKAGVLPAAQALDLARAYASETDYTVWADLAGSLGELRNLVAAESYSKAFKAFGVSVYAKIVKHVGWDAGKNESHLTSMLRALAIGGAGNFGDPNVIAEAKKRFAAYLKDKNSLDSNLRGLVFNLVAAHGGKAEFEELYKIFQTADMHEEKMRAIVGMGSSRDPELIQRVLTMLLNGEVRTQDGIFVLRGVAYNPEARQLGYDWFKKNWEACEKLYGGGAFLFTRFISAFTRSFTTPEALADIKAFLASKRKEEYARTIDQSIESVEASVAWLKRDGASIKSWLAANKF